jgi:hypothetical protein
MTSPSDRELQQWADAWQQQSEPQTGPEAIRAYVGRRSRLLTMWVSSEIVICAAALGFLLLRTMTKMDPVEQLAMGLLALIAAGSLLFSVWNWRNALRASADTTSAFLALSIDRVRRLRRAIRFGWGILAAELLVLGPWIWYRLYGGQQPPTADAERFAWGLLVGITGLALLFMIGVQRWLFRETRILDELQRELGSDLDFLKDA